MGHPVTTNPLIIMMINMTVVFVVLISLSFLIKLIHAIDPTKKPEISTEDHEDEEDTAGETAAIISKLQAQNAAPAPAVEEGISPEVIAAITAAIACCGISGQVRAVRVVNNGGAWRQNSPNKILAKK